ncbi:hypothetical protein BN1195_03602 [Chryseobacterium oranimense G311]|uniref:hypothetical protein n=1 Tax=Chryseobacterium oranimense TaxID=421058 RepID=UPI000533A631|nr:hypothetical protein [Chryseobacterium oranimense]CEJ71257.1 hypothetical protein BN1195_03602 [Chryseobacterium oranimense G311]DAG72875.1 MAG TPA: hypothetical protein [Caudoviricetes sp.]
MKNNISHKIYQDSKEIPFWNYKRIDQTGDYLYMIKGYESGDEVEADLEALKVKFEDIERDYAVTINMKSEEVLQYGQIAVSQNEANRYLLLIGMIDLLLKTQSIRKEMEMEPSEDFNEGMVRELIQEFKIQKCESLTDQRQKLIEKVEKHKNRISKIQSELKKQDEEIKDEDFNLTDQFICLQMGLEMQIDDRQISLYEFGLYVRKLVEKVEASNKLLKNVR